MNLVSISENNEVEKRLAITPEIAKKYLNLGFALSIPKNYGKHLGFKDEDYKQLGVNVLDDEEKIVSKADIIVQIGLPDDKKLSYLKDYKTKHRHSNI